jgi:farnesyl diphosphate synthase
MVASQKVSDEQLQRENLRRLLMDMCHYFQVEDDWLDVYGDPLVMGKVGTDLKSGKMT